MKHVPYLTLAVSLVLAACAGATSDPPSAAGAPSPGPLAPASPSAQAGIPAGNLPLKFAGGPTVPAITARDLMTRVYIFADDSMGGRQVGTEYNLKGAAYIARELQRLGVQPAGENGTYYQDVPVFTRALDAGSTIKVGDRTLVAGTDFVAIAGDRTLPLNTVQIVFGGTALDTMNVPTPAAWAGKVVLLRPFTGQFTSEEEVQTFLASDGFKRYNAALELAAGAGAIGGEMLSPNAVRSAMETPALTVGTADPKTTPVSFSFTAAAAAALLGADPATMQKGAAGRTVQADIRFNETRKPARNVIGVIPGSDPALRGQYVVFGAHNDHVGFTPTAVDHDSLRAFNTVLRRGGVEDQAPPAAQITAEQWARVNAIKDSLRALNGGMRRDSINNGADDDASGSMGILEIAELFSRSADKPKRSLLFVWHTGEEMGMWGSGYFVDNPTVPRDSIVGALNVDMIGRGGPDDITNGGPAYLQLLGSRRLSTEFGDLVETVNREQNAGFNFDYQFDADGHPQRFYCRSDHWSYARWGIPVTFFSTGGHRDYHMRTDEPQYINYPHYTNVTQFIADVGARVANLDHRLVVDKPKGDPTAECVQ